MTSEVAVKEEAAPAPEVNAEATETVVDESLLKSVAERLKFFFSDANIRQDLFIRKFLMTQNSKKNNNNDDKGGAVPVDVLLKFNTIKALTKEPDVVAKAVTTQMSDILEVRGDGGSIGRVKPFTESMLNENIPLSLYLKNLPTKNNDYNQKQYAVRMDDIRKMFEQYGEVALVKLRFKKSAQSDDDDHTDDIKTEPAAEENEPPNGKKKPHRRFPLGACLVEFSNLESLEKAAEDVLTTKGGETVEAKRKLQVGDNTLEVMTLKDYVASLKKDRKRDRENGDEGGENIEADDKIDSFTIDWKPGCVISLRGLPDDCDREAILDATMAACNLTKDEMKEKKIYADYSRGQKDGALRFPETELAKMMVDKLKSEDEPLEIAGAKLEDAILLEGDAEKKYWDDFIEFKKKQMRHRAEERKHNHKGGRNNKRRRGGGGRDRW